MKGINKEIFDKEILICQESYQKQGGCNWGKCKECGVVLLLHKLDTGEIIENDEEIAQIKTKYLDR